MSVLVRLVGPDDDTTIGEAHAMCVGSVDDAMLCQPGAFWLSLGQIRRAAGSGRMYVAEDGGTVCGLALATNAGRVDWLRAPTDLFPASAAALCARVFADCGACWGLVQNPTVRAALTDADPHLVDDGPVSSRVWWRP